MPGGCSVSYSSSNTNKWGICSQKDDGYVYIQYYEYPLPTAAIKKNLTSEFNYTSLSRNYDSNLT